MEISFEPDICQLYLQLSGDYGDETKEVLTGKHGGRFVKKPPDTSSLNPDSIRIAFES
ncbi:hypothetical protein M378DRAFT_163936, partial [Amanita muscaria Koide BX008]